jgi:MFS superfamily sulfate permease-like transporter
MVSFHKRLVNVKLGWLMTSRHTIAIRASVSLGIILAILLVVRHSRRHTDVSLILTGSVVQQNADTRKESPIADVEVIAINGAVVRQAKSDFSGFFKIVLSAGVDPGQSVTLRFRHPDYNPVDMNATAEEKLYVIRMIPIHGEVEAELNEAEVGVSNVLVRYSTGTASTENIGTGVKTFQILNIGNVPCNQRFPCSPDGKWKAAIDSASLDAGDGNVFQDARVTCIAGPCPFTRVELNGFSRPARNINVSVRNWSDTTTFLLQAEVFHTQLRDTVRKAYPVIFGRALNFTLPADARGPAIEAELNRTQITFILAPNLKLSWTDCEVRVESNQAKAYRCELKPGYQFQ